MGKRTVPSEDASVVPAGDSPQESSQDTGIPGPGGAYDPNDPKAKNLPGTSVPEAVTGVAPSDAVDIDRDGIFPKETVNPPDPKDRKTY